MVKFPTYLPAWVVEQERGVPCAVCLAAPICAGCRHEPAHLLPLPQVGVCVIDTGARPTHQDLAPNIKAGWNT